MEQYALPLFFVVIAASLIAYSISSLDLTGMFVKTSAEQNVSTTQTTETKTQQEQAEQTVTTPTCPNCDDNNPCTKDSCDSSTNYTCKYTKTTGPTEGCNEYITGTCSKKTCMSGKCVLINVLNCCGNNVCEDGENYSNCAKDCPQTTTSGQTASTQQTTNQTQSIVNAANHVVISEIVTKGPTGASDEFVELYNPTSASIDITGWKIQYKSASGGSGWDSKVGSGLQSASIPSYGFYLLASKNYSLSAQPNYRHTATWGFSDSGGHIRIIDQNANEVDKVGYGTAVEPEGTAADASILSSAGSLERKPGINNPNGGNWQDTDNNANDFVSRDTPEPQNSFSATEIPS